MPTLDLPCELSAPPLAKAATAPGDTFRLYDGNIKIEIEPRKPTPTRSSGRLAWMGAWILMGLGCSYLVHSHTHWKKHTVELELGNASTFSDSSQAETGEACELFDPLDHLQNAFRSNGIRLDDEFDCGSCFFNDTGRVRRDPGAPDEEAFLMYKLPSLATFEVTTHMFNSDPNVPIKTNPFSFYVSRGPEIEWELIPFSYERTNTHPLGWEMGTFTGRSEAPMAQFFKILLHEMAEEEASPQVGQVRLMGPSGASETNEGALFA
eukprot:NODE_3342_length_985_cov_820.127040_g3196_i0.p1 GENE.NODE_3342_length_985_cov_820.127040_g3196_i0~~NODE_3342_length_985_cov_820.127040_g3196_i0.p1  ORF type:complete len:265 (+),score=43.41 NODE_3342_length_985_cov_820.127040_g3196_i0:58-852(+)